MLKYFTIFCFLTLSANTYAQRLDLKDVVEIYVAMDLDPSNAVTTISSELGKRAMGWSKPVITHPDNYFVATWSYYVGSSLNGVFRFVVQNVNGKPLVKIDYECPYEALFDNYVTDLKANGATLVDSSNEPDGGFDNVYKYKSYIFILAKWPQSLGRTFGGIQTGYVKILLHHEVDQ